MNPEVQEVDVLRVGADTGLPVCDVAAAEEPLELRLGGERFVVIMRTPGDDRHLATGFLLSEQIVRSASDISAMRYCADQDGRDSSNVLSVWLNGDAALRAHHAMSGRRHVTSNSSCGVCGRRSIDDLMAGVRRINGSARVRTHRCRFAPATAAGIAGDLRPNRRPARGWPVRLPRSDSAHAAEDVGRHNAVDKVIGAALMAGGIPLSDRVLFVSGRTSFEIVQKAWSPAFRSSPSVSAPSSLAVELARESGVTLLGFVRDGGFNIYAGRERIAL